MSSGGWGEGLMCWYEGMHWGQEDIWRLIETFILSGLLRQEHAGLDYKYLIIFRSSGGILVFIRGFSLDLTARIRVFPVTILIHYNRNARLHFSPSSDGSREKPLKRIFSLNFNLFSFFLVERNPKYCSFCHDDVNEKKLEELPYYSSSSHLSQSTQTYVRLSCDLAGHRLMAGWDLDITQIFSFHRGTGSIITRGDWEQGRGGGGRGEGWLDQTSLPSLAALGHCLLTVEPSSALELCTVSQTILSSDWADGVHRNMEIDLLLWGGSCFVSEGVYLSGSSVSPDGCWLYENSYFFTEQNLELEM